MQRPIIRIAAGTFALIILLLGAVYAFGGFAGLGAGGTIALMFGIIVSIGLGIGLMTLMFYSSRSERDEAVHIAGCGGPPDDRR